MQQPLCHYWSLAEGENLPLANFFKKKRSLRLLTHHPCCAWIPPPLQRADKWHTGSALVPLLKQWASARAYIRPGNTSGGYPGRQSNGRQPEGISAPAIRPAVIQAVKAMGVSPSIYPPRQYVRWLSRPVKAMGVSPRVYPPRQYVRQLSRPSKQWASAQAYIRPFQGRGTVAPAQWWWVSSVSCVSLQRHMPLAYGYHWL